MLVRVAEVTQGWSAAALANLMNEAAILTASPRFQHFFELGGMVGVVWARRIGCNDLCCCVTASPAHACTSLKDVVLVCAFRCAGACPRSRCP